jgi:phosphate transport system substrate-binding protein
MKEHRGYVIRAALLALLAVPLIISVAFVVGALLGIGLVLLGVNIGLLSDVLSVLSTPFLVLFPCLVVIMFWRHFVCVEKTAVPTSLLWRFFPMVVASTYYITVWSVSLVIGGFSYAASSFGAPFMLLTFPWFAFTLVFNDLWWFPFMQLLVLLVSVGTVEIVSIAKKNPGTVDKHLFITGVLVILLCVTPLVLGHVRSRTVMQYDYSIEAVGGDEVDLWRFHPFSEDNELEELNNPTLRISSRYPRLDGATAVYPVYAAVAQAAYGGLTEERVDEYVSCTTTRRAYQRLIDGEADVFFGLQPSEEQQAAAQAAGVELQLTSIGQEAFVFIVNEDNPVENLTLSQVKDIYQKNIVNWAQVGGTDEEILAFQRAENSGSQTIMQAKVMDGEKMARPLIVEQSQNMGGLIAGVAEYQNYAEAIGYTFRYYAIEMNPNSSVKLLAIDGVMPTVENIRNGSYPYVVDIYAVTAGSENVNVPALLDWLTSTQGQDFIEQCGYVRKFG